MWSSFTSPTTAYDTVTSVTVTVDRMLITIQRVDPYGPTNPTCSTNVFVDSGTPRSEGLVLHAEDSPVLCSWRTARFWWRDPPSITELRQWCTERPRLSVWPAARDRSWRARVQCRRQAPRRSFYARIRKRARRQNTLMR